MIQIKHFHLSNMQGEIGESWKGFLSEDQKDAADSTYCGCVGEWRASNNEADYNRSL